LHFVFCEKMHKNHYIIFRQQIKVRDSGTQLREVIELNRKILLTILALTAVLLATPYIGMVHATLPTDVLFYVPMEGFGGTAEVRQTGESNNWISYGNTFGFVEGDIIGSMTAEAHWIYHFEDEWVGPELDPYMLTVPFRGNGGPVLTIDPDTVMGIPVTGTLTLKFVTRGNEFAGTWAIQGGTGDLKGIAGQGTWYIDPGYGLIGGQAFEGQIHINP
jgi:hypothetical protein